MRRFREALGTLILGLPAVLLFVTSASAQAPPAPKVTVAQPLAKHITTWDEYSGRFEAVESVEVRPRVSGFVDKVHFKDGQIVKAGDPLFTIDPRPFEIAAESARAEINRAKATVALAMSEVERAAPLVKSGAVTERDFTQRSANLSVTEAQLQVSEANLKTRSSISNGPSSRRRSRGGSRIVRSTSATSSSAARRERRC